MRQGFRFCLLALAFLAFLGGAWALCQSDAECKGVSCPGGGAVLPLCNVNTKTCYCAPSSCGDYSCGANESFQNCPIDCPQAGCGNGVCDGSESSATCPADCKPVCGNGVCEAGENALSCAGDCAASATCCQWITDAYGGKTGCAQYCAQCGDLVCDPALGEDAASCPRDCKPNACGDGVCDTRNGEDYLTCSLDCKPSECKSDLECVGVGNCDYVVGQDYPAHGESVFNVCACAAGVCEVKIKAAGVCGDQVCLNESCNPNSTNYCAGDCGTCKEPSLVIETAAPEQLTVNSGDKVKLEITVDNVGAAKSKPFLVRVYLKEGEQEKQMAEFKSEELPITNLAVDYADLVGYLAASRALKPSGLVSLQSAGGAPRGVPPSAVLTATPFYGLKPLNVLFDASRSSAEGSSLAKYELDFDGDGVFDVSFEPPAVQVNHVYEEAGLYNATLKAVNKEGMGALDGVRVLVLERPVRRVVELDTTGLCGAVTFVVAIEDAVDPTIKAATKDVTLFVVCKREPTPVIKASPDHGAAPLTVSFDGGQSVDEDGSIAKYAWDFGDGGAGSGKAVAEHTYAKNGEYAATLTVTDNDGQPNTQAQTIVVGQAPVAVIEASVTEGKPPLSVNFSAAKSSDSDGRVEAFEWDFGDGEQGAGETVSHVFRKTGEYKVGLRVRDNDGIHGKAGVDVVAGSRPKAVIEGQEQTFLNLRTVFDGSASSDDEGIVSYAWDFGDGEKAAGARVSHSFREVGVKKVKLTVTDTTGLKQSAEAEARVFGSDQVDLQARLVEPLVPSVVQNQDFDLKFEVVNAGEKPADKFRVALFADSLDGGTPLGEAEVPGLAPLASGTVSFRVNSGEKLRGVKYLLSVDSGRQVKESNEVNNVVEFSKSVVLMEVCGNDFDDNLNGYVDEGCGAKLVEVCGNGVDDDQDGLVDEGCAATNAAVSGLPLQVAVDKAEPGVGEEQVVRVTHPLLGSLKEATVTVTSPKGNVARLKTDATGVVRYKVQEAGKYVVEAYKYTLSAQKEFRGLSGLAVTQRQLILLPVTLFGRQVLEMPLLIMVLLLLCVIAMVLAYDRSAVLFREELEIVKSAVEEARERGVRLGVGMGFFFVPLAFNKAFGFEAGVASVVVEIIVLYLTMHFERERY